MAVTQATNGQEEASNDLEARIRERLKDAPDKYKNPHRDDAARQILTWQAQGEWPLSGAEMEERGDWSAQHYRNVLAWYGLDEDGFHTEDESHVRGGGLHIPVPDDLDGRGEVRAYVRGWLDNLDRE